MSKIICEIRDFFSYSFGSRGSRFDGGCSGRDGAREAVHDNESWLFVVLVSIGLGAGFSAAFLSMLSAV